jgi:hypothetical protein
MRTPFLLLAPVFAAGILAQSGCTRSEAQTPGIGKDLPSAPGIGTKCTLKLYSEAMASLSLSSPEISGVLAADTPDWVCVKENSTEHWVPKARVLELKLTR